MTVREPLPLPPMLSSRRKVSSTKVVTEKKLDGNVVLIPLRILGDEPQIVTGDPIKCGQCSAVLTSTAVLQSEGKTKTWNCEFCGHKNTGLDLSVDEVPKGHSIDFMLSPPTKLKKAASNKKKETTPGVIVYCMDVSCSMEQICHIPEAQALWRQERTRGLESISQVTRLKCIKNAVERLTEQLKLEDPEKKVLLTVFNSGVHVTAGGRTDKLPSFLDVQNKTFKDLLAMGLNLYNEYPLKTIEESFESVKERVRHLSSSGNTALGPALSICAGFVSKIPGSEIVLCTDGEPHVGVGSLNDPYTGREFYRQVGNYARSKNTTINILAIGEDSVGLQHVSAAADNSGGVTNRLNPMEIMRQLRLIAQNSVIATAVSVRFYLPTYFCFVEPDYPDNLSRLEKEIGNVRKETEMFFRFKPKDPSQHKDLSSVPFQVQITYTRPDGMRCLRILSKSVPATTSRKDMERKISVSVLGVTTMKATSQLAQVGKPVEAQHMLKNVKRLVQRIAKSNEQMEERLAFHNEIQALDEELTSNSSNLANISTRLDDTVFNRIYNAGAKTVGSLAAAVKRKSVIQNRKMDSACRSAYYNYKDNF